MAKRTSKDASANPRASGEVTQLVRAGLGPQLAEQERQFREMLESCPAALVIVDEDGRLLFLSTPVEL